jgi:hypothetical protein
MNTVTVVLARSLGWGSLHLLRRQVFEDEALVFGG